MIAAVVAVDKNFGIGNNNELLAHIPEDLKNFKKLTTGHTVIMGRKTYDSLSIKPLPDRANIVVTSNINNDNILEIRKDGVLYTGLDVIKGILIQLSSITFDVFIIGGGTIYKELLPYCDKIYLTKIHHSYGNVDTYFPNIDNMPEWEIMMSSDIRKCNNIEYQFCIYERGSH